MLQNINNGCEIVGSEPSENGRRTPEIPADFRMWKYVLILLPSIIFTMGTTVDAKGAMLTHGGFLSNVQAVAKALPPTDTGTHLIGTTTLSRFEFFVQFVDGTLQWYDCDLRQCASSDHASKDDARGENNCLYRCPTPLSVTSKHD